METDADHVVSSILHDIDDFRIEVGTLTLLFAQVEDMLAHGIVQTGALTSSPELATRAEKARVMPLRVLEKRNLMKEIIAEFGRFYGVDCTRVLRLLDELGNLNKVRRTIVHGFIRWSPADEKPVFMDSHGTATSAWPWDVLEVNHKVAVWLRDFVTELAIVLIATLENRKASIDRLLDRTSNSTVRGYFAVLQSRIAEVLEEINSRGASPA